MKKYLQYFLVLFFVFFLVFLSFNKKEPLLPSIENIQYIKIADIMIKVELANTKEQLAQGLSGRTHLVVDTGMLFVFPVSGMYLFWMQDMHFPIDIVWINDAEQIIYIEKNIKPSSYPKTFGAGVMARYVLEIPANFAEKNNFKIGDEVEFLY